MLTLRQNIASVIESTFAESKEELQEVAVNRIMELVDEPTEITYQNCSDALLKMWMDNVLTDGEFNRIMERLNKRK